MSGGPLRRLLVAAAIVTAALSSPAAAQDRPRTWLGLGLGLGSGRDTEGLGLMAELVHQKRAHHIAVRGVLLVDPFGESADSMGDFGVLYGRAAKGRFGHGAIATGVALTGFESCPSAPGGGCATLGIPIVAEAAFRPAPVFGLGVQAFANLNRKTVFGGVVVFIQLGWMP